MATEQRKAEGERGRLTAADELSRIVDALSPPAPESGRVVHAVGYGSGVFAQQKHHQPSDVDDGGGGGGENDVAETDGPDGEEDEELPMIDLLLSVDDALSFHGTNLARHPDHYSSLCRALGPAGTASIQRSEWGAKVFFNPLVDYSPVDDDVEELSSSSQTRRRKIKYGVIQTDDLLRDLTEWECLYVAGRMHKPTASVAGWADDRVEEAQRTNLDMALGASLLLLGGDDDNDNDNDNDSGGRTERRRTRYDLTELYHKIAGLSYGGDPRMDVGGEDPAKVSKLVGSPGQEGRFWDLYRPHLEALSRRGVLTIGYRQGSARCSGGGGIGGAARVGSSVEWDAADASARRELLSSLPRKVRRYAGNNNNGGDGNAAAMTPSQLAAALAGIVGPAARYQSVKGLLTAGVGRSVKYAAAKFAKGAFRNLR